MDLEFVEFNKIARLNREMMITEKIDGTNAQVFISDDGQFKVGCRTRWITPGKQTDNFGFAKWAEDNREELLQLGPGRHYGEWWGCGIQRGYGLSERRFSLFNPKWTDETIRPRCCHVVPTLFTGLFDTGSVHLVLASLVINGSKAAPGYMDPEGLVIYHKAAGRSFKVTIKGDEKPKGDSHA